MDEKHYIAIDMGAESGRVILGTLAGGKVEIEEMARFPTGATRFPGSLRWNVVGFFAAIQEGLRKAGKAGKPISSISANSWGVDYGYVSDADPLLSPPFMYRDPRTNESFAHTWPVVSREKLYEITGIQMMDFNTVYQLHHDKRDRPKMQQDAKCFLHIADLMNFFLSGVAKVEESLASTSQIYDTKARAWSEEIIQALDLPPAMFPEVVPSGTVLGELAADLKEGLSKKGHFDAAKVVASCSHDTAAAVVAVPSTGGEDWAYLSSGTWSLLGAELAEPLRNEAALEAGFSNELGAANTVRFLKNIAGLWMVQECRRAWQHAGQEYSYSQLTAMANAAKPLQSIVHPNCPEFLKPDQMPEKIQEYCRKTGQHVPEGPGEIMRCCVDSLALCYDQTLNLLETVTGRSVKKLHIVGGGIKNALLNQATADAIGKEVVAGPTEATAMGNLLIQAMAMGDVADVAEIRQIVAASSTLKTYQPENTADWSAARTKFSTLPVKPLAEIG